VVVLHVIQNDILHLRMCSLFKCKTVLLFYVIHKNEVFIIYNDRFTLSKLRQFYLQHSLVLLLVTQRGTSTCNTRWEFFVLHNMTILRIEKIGNFTFSICGNITYSTRLQFYIKYMLAVLCITQVDNFA